MRKRWFYKGHHGLIKFQLEHLKEYVDTLDNLLNKEVHEFNAYVDQEAAKLDDEEKDNFMTIIQMLIGD